MAKNICILDYGLGNILSLKNAISHLGFQNYLFSDMSKKNFDCSICIDVLEHIFINDVPWVINDLFKHANKCVVINVACYNAAALLPNGENAHITVRPPSWWLGQIECISSLHPDVYWALFASESYNNSNFYGVHRMKDRLDSKNFYQ